MRQVEGPSASNCRRNEVSPAISVKGKHRIKTESLLLSCHVIIKLIFLAL